MTSLYEVLEVHPISLDVGKLAVLLKVRINGVEFLHAESLPYLYCEFEELDPAQKEKLMEGTKRSWQAAQGDTIGRIYTRFFGAKNNASS